MKKLVWVLFFAASVDAQGQTSVYHPFPDSAIFWRENFITGHGQSCCCWGGPCVVIRDYQYFLNGDTLIGTGTYTYKKIFKTGAQLSHISGPPTCPPWCTDYNWVYYVNEYAGGMRQDTALRKVYYVYPSFSSEELLYDFDLSAGDTLPFSWTNQWFNNYVSSVDSILIGSTYRKRFNILPAGASLIEGIGSTFGLLYPLVPNFEDINTLVCVIIDSLTVYPDTTSLCPLPTGITELMEEQIFFIISPNPATNELIVESSKYKVQSVEIYDVFGKKVYNSAFLILNSAFTIDVSKWNAGVYFVCVRTENNAMTRKIIIAK